ncbi:MAG: hypothetical protein ACFFG0_24210 [Candidatus Thorarchaeota archaeon]
MSNLKESIGIINLDKLIKEFDKIEDFIKTTLNSVDIIKNQLEEYGLSKKKFNVEVSSGHIKS